jgi:hypothetical protein
LRGAGKSLEPELLAQGKELILEGLNQIRLRQYPHIGHNKHAMQKTGDQRSMLGAQQPPGRVILAQQIEGGVVKGHEKSQFTLMVK